MGKTTQLDLLVNPFIKKWGNRAFFGILDQGLFSGSNFLVSFLLARWLSQDNYGVFSIAFACFLFFSGVPSALVWEPMSVFGATQDKLDFACYLKQQLVFQVIISVALALILSILSLFVDTQVRQTFMYASLAMPFMLMVWFFRQACYIKAQSKYAFFVSLTYSILYLLILLILKFTNHLSSGVIYFGLAFSSLISSWLATRLLGIKLEMNLPILNRSLFLENWIFGKYILLATIASGVSSLLYLPLLGIWVGLSEAGAYRAIQNFILPAQQMVVALTLILLPQLSKIVAIKGKQESIKIFTRTYIFVLLFVISYVVFLLLFNETLVKIFYQNPFYGNFTWLIPLIGSSFLVTFTAQMLGILVRAIKKPQAILWSKASSALFMIVFGLFVIWKLGIIGIVICTFATSIIEVLVLFILIRSNIS